MNNLLDRPLIFLNSLSLICASRRADLPPAPAGRDGGQDRPLARAFLHPERVAGHRAIALQYGLHFTLHQPWSYNESGGMLSNRLLSLLGILPKDGYLLSDIARQADGENFVIYGDRFPEIARQKTLPGTHTSFVPLFQTASAWNGFGLERKHRLSYENFIRYVIEGMPQVGIVYDTVHALELALHAPTGKELMQFSEAQLLKATKCVIKEIGFFEGRGKEIHFNDNDGSGTDGRCLAGDGKLAPALKWLAGECVARGWRGPIIPEVSPKLFLFNAEKNLARVHARVDSFFS